MWILDRWRDLLLFVGTPVLLIPIFTAAQARWSAQDIFLFVGAFGAMGHHLPGMIRAYGDRALFHRFRIRFVVAPLVLLSVCVWASVYNIQAIQLVALAWGIWHGMMQTYGFCRIYDAKASGKAAARARIDLALCFAWFLGAVILSPMRFRTCLDLYYESGGPLVTPDLIVGLKYIVIAALALITAAFAWRQWRDWRSSGVISPIKMTLLVSSIAFWWYCNNGVQNILVGIALFEVFHDVQYLAIVWIYNRARVERDESIHGFMRFVFRRSGSLIGVYVGLVLAYGSIALTTSGVSVEAIKHVLIGVVTASALLHFYYDGFIWKVRETQTRAMLGIDGSGVSTLPAPRAWPSWIRHGLRWTVLVVPVAALCAAQLGGRVVPAIERTAKVAEILPRDAQAQLNYGKALHEAGRMDEAIERYEEAIKRDPKLAEAEFYLALAWYNLKDPDKSIEHYQRALHLDPKNGDWEFRLARALVAKELLKEARARFEHSLSLDPNQRYAPLAHKEFADLLCRLGEYQSAVAHYEEALRMQPDYPDARESLAFARSFLGN
ncbi:MAG TPA: tetratricopeptide repeat protein [Chthoniobacterales bacterium]|nr:tetratricopeptide repeat protein [Chthoniobacterales bacterium]